MSEFWALVWFNMRHDFSLRMLRTLWSPRIKSAGSSSTTWRRTPSGYARACPGGSRRPGERAEPTTLSITFSPMTVALSRLFDITHHAFLVRNNNQLLPYQQLTFLRIPSLKVFCLCLANTILPDFKHTQYSYPCFSQVAWPLCTPHRSVSQFLTL